MHASCLEFKKRQIYDAAHFLLTPTKIQWHHVAYCKSWMLLQRLNSEKSLGEIALITNVRRK